MGQFLEVQGWPHHSKHGKRDNDLDTFQVRVAAIVKVVPLETSSRVYVPLGTDPAPARDDPYYKSASEKFVDSCELVFSHDIPTSGLATRVVGTANDLVKKVEECRRKELLEDDQAIQDQRSKSLGIELVDRGTWEAGASYVRWDVVKHPDNDEQYLAVAPSQSNSNLVLKNHDYWCKIG